MPTPHTSSLTTPTKTATVLAFDFGLKRIGIAVGETLLNHAEALTVIADETNDGRFAAIAKLLEEWRPALLVVGLPLAMDGTPHEMTARCRRFGNQLHGRFGLPVVFADERLTSSEADGKLREAGLNWQERKARVDALAAQIILQAYFDSGGTVAHSDSTSLKPTQP